MPTLLLLVVGDVRSGAGVVKFPAAAALLPPGRDSGPFRAYAQFSFLRPSVPLQFQIKSSAEGRKEGTDESGCQCQPRRFDLVSSSSFFMRPSFFWRDKEFVGDYLIRLYTRDVSTEGGKYSGSRSVSSAQTK